MNGESPALFCRGNAVSSRQHTHPVSPVGARSAIASLALLGLTATLSLMAAPESPDRANASRPPARPTRGPAPTLINWRSGPVVTIPQNPTDIMNALESAIAQNIRHLVMQFDRPVDATLRARLDSAGVRLLDYLGNHAFFAAIPPDEADAGVLSEVDALISARPIEPAHKLHPLLARDTAALACDGRGTAAATYVVFHRDVPLAAAAVPICRQHGATVRSRLRTVNALVVELPWTQIPPLAEEDAVQWIEPALPPLSQTNDSNRQITQADEVQAAPYELDGTDVTVLVYDIGSVDPNHPDFAGRLTLGDDAGPSNHSTHVAGTVGGDGTASAGLYRGMAPNVNIVSYVFAPEATGLPLYTDPGDIETDYLQAINLYAIDLATNSIGTNTCRNGFNCEITGDYGVTSTVIDSIVGGGLGQPLIVLFANGNERSCQRCRDEGVHTPEGYHSTAPPACAKNHISVGAVNSDDDSVTFFTSWGPADDGRIKPDIVAPGCQQTDDNGVTSCAVGGEYITYCGTSMAAPTAAGLSALLLQDLRQQWGTGLRPVNSTIKCLLAHSADDIASPGPDYQSGYGSVRIRDTIDFARTGRFYERAVDQDQTASFLVRVDPSDSQLKVTLAWDDVPGTPNVTPALVNDLDLVVYDPSLEQHFPWTLDPEHPDAFAQRNQADHTNNIEQVLVGDPAPGLWTVYVSGFDVPEGPQSFSICGSPHLAPDCDGNGIPDDEEILNDPSLDCTGNGILDVCEPDCNENGQADSCDIADELSEDCDGNGVPDECQPDCNENGTADACDIINGTSADCDANGVPDECQDTSADCNENGIWDACDIADGFSLDENFNGVPDECEESRTVYVDDDAPLDPGPGDPMVSDPDEDGTPEHPFDAIQEAIDAALDGDAIIVADGLYAWFGNVSLEFAGKAVALQSANGPQSCVIDCEGVFRGFLFDSGETPATRIEGFTIRDGFDGFWGGAAFCQNSSPAFVNCVFDGCWGVVGGAVYLRSASPVLTDCVFSNNWGGYGGGIFVTGDSSPTITNCTFSHNTGMLGGGAATLFGSGVTRLVNCTFSENDVTGTDASPGEGAAILTSSDPFLVGCLFELNIAEGNGGGMHCRIGANPVLANCAFVNNAAFGPFADGGGLCLVDADASLTGCTFAGNQSDHFGGGISFAYDSRPTLLDCILWGNADRGGDDESAQIHDSGGYPSVRYCCVQGLTGMLGGVGNLSDDPLLVDLAAGNFHLALGSPCVNTGDPAFLPLPDETDIDGDPRALLERVDIGADEFVYAETDCNNNGIPDEQDIADQTSPDCNANDIPDECDLALGLALDCNQNGTPDSCDIADGSSTDCGDNGVPDECEPDCNDNANPDDCDITDEISSDCNLNGVPDECEPDCNANAVADECDVIDGTSDDFNNNGVPDECEDNRVIHVDDDAPNDPGPGVTWPSDPNEDGSTEHPFDAVQEAIDAAISGDTVLLADGVYAGYGNKNLQFRGRQITVTSATGPTNCIINCQDAGRAFFIGRRATPDIHIDGLTLTNGAISIGGAIYSEEGAPTITNCIIVGNASWYSGGASGGGIYLGASSALVCNCLIVGNTGTRGAGLTCTYQASPLIVNCTITGNRADDAGGGIACGNACTPTIVNTVLWDNVAEDGPQLRVIGEGTAATVAYSDVAGGQADVHVGELATLIWADGNLDADPRFRGGPGGVWTAEAAYDPNTYQTTLVDASAAWTTDDLVGKLLQPDVAVYVQGLIAANTATTVTVWGAYTALGLPDVEYQIHDNRITTCSPCIDAGDNTALPPPPPATDLAGGQRFVNDPFVADTGQGSPPIVDIGAYEYQADCRGDLTGDRIVNHVDLTVLLSSYGIDDRGDLNCDGITNLQDLAELLGAYGATCP